MWVDVEGGRLRLAIAGDGPPLLLLHGWPLDHRAFAPQFEGLSQSLTLIAPDRRGFGASTAPPDLAREIDDIDGILGALGLDSVHLLGMSQGARVALRYAALRPARLRSLIVQGAVVDGVPAEPGDAARIPLEEYAALARQGRLDALREAWLGHPMMSLEGVAPAHARTVRDIVGHYDGRDLAVETGQRYAFDVDVAGALAGFPHPALVLAGARETATRHAHAALLAATLPDARRFEFPDSGHLCNLSEPDAYNRAVLDFVRSVEAAR